MPFEGDVRPLDVSMMEPRSATTCRTVTCGWGAESQEVPDLAYKDLRLRHNQHSTVTLIDNQ